MARRARATQAEAKRPRGGRRGFALLVLAVLLGLAATASEQTFGTFTDEQQPLYTAVSIAQFGELGIGRGQLFSFHRKEGDAVSVYGMGLSLVEVPFALLAGPWERHFGSGSSQTLFVLLGVLLVTAASAGAGLLAVRLGADPFGIALATLGTAFASPLWAYPAAGYSEALQAVLLVFAVLAASRAVREEGAGTRLALLAGFLAGYAVLTKSVNLALGPFLIAPVVLDGDARAEISRRVRLVAAAGLGALLPLGSWLLFEIVRFGRPFASYRSQRFTHGLLDGLWRLLVGPNKGLLVYFPLLLIAVLGTALLARDHATRGTAIAVASTLVVSALVAARWWAWDGTMGWGPRLLVPAIPALAAAAGVAASRRPSVRIWALLLGALGVGVNVLGILQSESAALAYVSLVPSERLSAEEAAKYPGYFLEKGAGGEPRLRLCYTASLDWAFSPLRVHLFLLRARLASSDPEVVRSREKSAPWLPTHPGLVPDFASAPAHLTQVRLVADPFTWPHLGMATVASASRRASGFNPTYGNALSDQVARAFDTGRTDRAAELSERLYALNPSGYTAALHAEALRLSSRAADLQPFLGSLPELQRASPYLAIVRSYDLRSRGDESAARETLGHAARLLRSEALARLAVGPLDAWPSGLRGVMVSLFSPRMMSEPGS